MNFFLRFFFFFLLSICTQGLPVDEKLPLRILNISETKKTMLINRGIEDGLAEGDHAKFFIPSGVIARGVVVKVAPTRSVWSMYRLVEGDALGQDKVMSLKITTPVKLTDDPTKMFSDEETPSSPHKVIELEAGAKSDDAQLVKDEMIKQTTSGSVPLFTDKTKELYGGLQFNAFNVSTSSGTSEQGSSGKKNEYELLLGFEKYFSDISRWYGRFSLAPHFIYSHKKAVDYQGSSITADLWGGGLALYWHFGGMPLELSRFIFYTGPMVGYGVAREETSGTTLEDGRAIFYSYALGTKYYFTERFGIRFHFDYYVRSTVYKVDGDSDYTQKVSGPRFWFGLGWRF